MDGVIVSGVVALDHIITECHEERNLLGGSASFAALAAAFHSEKVHLHGVAGKDFPFEYLELLARKGVSLDGLDIMEGKTFRWGGKYGVDMNDRETISRELNVLGEWDMRVPDTLCDCPVIIMASATSKTHLSILSQFRNPRLILADTMDHWIIHERKETDAVVGRSDIFLLNEREAYLYAGTRDLHGAGMFLLNLGAHYIIIKQGANGSTLFGLDEEGQLKHFHCPAWPLSQVVDPTGAGDSYLGALGGYLSQCKGKISWDDVKQGMAWGSVTASIICENFSTWNLDVMTKEEYFHRFALFRELSSC